MRKKTKSVKNRPVGRKTQAQRGRALARRRMLQHERALEAALAALAHDIRTPLTGILALSELLATSGLPERERGWANTIKDTGEHLATLTSLIVDAVGASARRLVLRRTLFDPQRLVDDLATSLAARAAAKGLQSGCTVSGELPRAAMGDALRLRSALENLIDNAVKFTDAGSVRLAISSQRLPRARVRFVFAVTDSGIGLKASEIKRLFRPFTQANADIAARYGGAGLGLSFVRRIAKSMNGDLDVASQPGRGSTFRLVLTLDRAADDKVPSASGAFSRVGTKRTLRVLCVDENPHGRVVLNTILTQLGHRADFAVTGEAAIETLSANRYDVVLMDMMLSDISGIEATRRIRSLPGQPIPVVGISGRGSTEEQARAAGMVGYLQKPFGPGDVARALAPIAAAPTS